MSKGGGALSMWIKEFTALVFTQTIQAFIYAIIITIILYGMGNTNNVSGNDNNSALGLMATFALLSVFKVEELAKKIFGVGDTKASHKNAMQSIAKTAIAAKLGGRVLNNTGKVLGGIKSINQAGQDRRKAKKRLDEDMKDNGAVMGKDGKPVFVGKNKSAGTTGGASKINVSTEGGASSSGGGSTTSTGGTSGTARVDIDENGISDADKRRVKNALRTYEDKLSEINKSRREGVKSIASGLTESVTATFGATAGGLLGGADGNIDEMLQGIMAGAGAGDIVGKNMVEAVDRATQFVQRNYKRESGMSNKQLQRAISNYKDALEKSNVNYGSSKLEDSEF